MFDTDKYTKGLIDFYINFFNKYRYVGNILEIGVLNGGFLDWLLARNQFKKIIGIDIEKPKRDLSDFTFIKCNQRDADGLRKIAEEHGPFDVIIDDGSHNGNETVNCFNTLWGYTRGVYFIEDWDVAHLWPGIPGPGDMITTISNIIQQIPSLEAKEMMTFYKKVADAGEKENPGKYLMSVFYLIKNYPQGSI